MKHLYAFVTLFLLITSLSFAQRDFRPGYIVQNGDTVRGLVNYQGDKRQAVLATYKPNKEAKEQNFTPVQISAYGIDNGYLYESKKIISPDSTYNLFLTVLVKGPANLYFRKDKDSKDHFYLEKADSLQELVIKTVIEEKKTPHSTLVTYHKATYKLYKNAFYNAFKDCPTIGAAINKIELKEADLIEVVAQYNQCSNPESAPLYQVKARKSIVTYGMLAGATMGSLMVTGNQQPSYELSSDLGYQTGLSLNITLPWASVNTSALLEAQYAYSSYQEQDYREHNSLKTNYTIDAVFHHLKFPASIRHTFPFGKLNPFINGGVVMNYTLAQKQHYVGSSKYSYSNTVTIEDGDFIKYTRNLSSGFTVGGGILYKGPKSRKYSLEARLEKNNGFSGTPSYVTEVSQISILTGIYF